MHFIAMLILCLLALASLVNAGCTGTEWKNGRLHAFCTDEVTGYDFEFIDLDDSFGQSYLRISDGVEVAFAADDRLNEQIYAGYEDVPVVNASNLVNDQELSVVEKQATTYWQDCKRFMSGLCTNEHLVAWADVLNDFSSMAIAALPESRLNGRGNKAPRSICSKYAGKGSRLCVSWAAVSRKFPRVDQARLMADIP